MSGVGWRAAARRATVCPVPLSPGAPRMPLTGCPTGPGAFTLKKLECSKQAAARLNTAARNNGIGLRFYFVGFRNQGHD